MGWTNTRPLVCLAASAFHAAFTCMPMPALVSMLALFLTMGASGRAHGGVRVVVGPTPIAAGEAKSEGDITVINEKLAFALAVGSPAPYGVPRGAIIDVAPGDERRHRPGLRRVRGLHPQ